MTVKVVVGVGLTAGLPVPVTVKVYAPGVVPDLPPQPDRELMAAISTKAPSIARQLRRLAGIPRNASIARTAPPEPIHPAPWPFILGQASAALVEPVEMVTVAVPLVADPLRLMAELPAVQDGRLTAPEGDD